MQKINLENAIIAGRSVGGRTAIEFLFQFPQKVFIYFTIIIILIKIFLFIYFKGTRTNPDPPGRSQRRDRGRHKVAWRAHTSNLGKRRWGVRKQGKGNNNNNNFLYIKIIN